jgi:hypothetical protein
MFLAPMAWRQIPRQVLQRNLPCLSAANIAMTYFMTYYLDLYLGLYLGD